MAAVKGVVGDACCGAVGGNLTGFASGDQGFCSCFDQTIADAVIDTVAGVNADGGETDATAKGVGANFGEPGREDDTGQVAAAVKSFRPDGENTVGQVDAMDELALEECLFINGGNRLATICGGDENICICTSSQICEDEICTVAA